jgi:hypothetical protein
MIAYHAAVPRGWHGFFGVAAAFNFLIGGLGLIDPAADTNARIISLLVFCFGILYALTARQPLRYAPALWAGVIGKLGVVAMLGPPNWQAGGDPLIGGVVIGDLLFALGFAVFLWRYRSG